VVWARGRRFASFRLSGWKEGSLGCILDGGGGGFEGGGRDAAAPVDGGKNGDRLSFQKREKRLLAGKEREEKLGWTRTNKRVNQEGTNVARLLREEKTTTLPKGKKELSLAGNPAQELDAVNLLVGGSGHSLGGKGGKGYPCSLGNEEVRNSIYTGVKKKGERRRDRSLNRRERLIWPRKEKRRHGLSDKSICC